MRKLFVILSVFTILEVADLIGEATNSICSAYNEKLIMCLDSEGYTEYFKYDVDKMKKGQTYIEYLKEKRNKPKSRSERRKSSD